jgi:pimeloyl-ACP methyl ester carboxylesterase
MVGFDFMTWIAELHALGGCENLVFLTIDYPGYGYSSGSPSPDSINEATDSGIRSGLAHLGALGVMIDSVNLLGHSVGAAVATRWVSENQKKLKIGKLILSAPFTSIVDMVPVIFPFIPRVIAKMIARHNWDNLHNLKTIEGNIKIQIIHGKLDEICPYEMGLRLASETGRELVTIEGAFHNNILNLIKEYHKLILQN